jgi:two-component system sensor histidine kinase HydH
MRILSSKKLYLPALSIVAVVFLLLVIISVSTYRNLDREKTMALHFFYRQGVALLHSIEASARTGMKTMMWQEVSLGSLLQETAKDKDIAYVYLDDEHGNIVHHSDPSEEGKPAAWKPTLNDDDQVATRIKTLPDGNQIYELAKFFAPMYEPSMLHHQQGMMGYGQMVQPHTHRGDVIVLGMRMTAFEEARHADIQHAFIMAAIILILGSGTLFFIFVIQNYYLVDQTLKQTRDYTRQVVANMANGLLSINTEGKIVSYNLLALELLGLKESEVRGMDLNTVVDFKTSGICKTLTDSISVLEHEIYHSKKSGQIVPLALSATPIRNSNGRCEGAVIVLRDLTEIKQLEEKVKRTEKLAAIGELAAGVAHEIRNPLSSIRGFAQFLKQALKDRPKEQEYAQTMVNEVDRINRVVTDLLTFARPMAAKLAPTDVTELVEHAVRLVQPEAESCQAGIQMKVSDLSKLPLDANQMTQALLNLLLNALQAVSQGGHVDIGAELNASDSKLRFWVEDDGPGISKDKIEKIFEPFFTTREKGTGLGLSIVHKIVENHNGEIIVESPSPGMALGCRFTIRIPTSKRFQVAGVRAEAPGS